MPLIRTPDRYRANADPLEYKLWPHDRRQLIDDLWALALAHLPALPAYEAQVNDRSALAGRALEPWRAILAVALWLDENGAEGLWSRMAALSESYQSERPDLETSDFTALIVRALAELAVAKSQPAPSAPSAPSAPCVGEIPPFWEFKTAEVTSLAHDAADDAEGDIDPEKVTSKRVGKVLRKLRLEKLPRPRNRGPHTWKLKIGDLGRALAAYGMPMPSELQNADPTPAHGAHGANGAHGAAGSPAADELLAGTL